MIQNLKIILIIFFIGSSIDFTNGYNCYDDSKSDDCSCVTGVCSCTPKTPTNVRQGLPCSIVNYVDSVSLIIIIIIIIKLLQDKDPVEQDYSRHPAIAAFDTVSFEASII